MSIETAFMMTTDYVNEQFHAPSRRIRSSSLSSENLLAVHLLASSNLHRSIPLIYKSLKVYIVLETFDGGKRRTILLEAAFNSDANASI